mmetsp:Transcript_59918/g.126847  ORF Transcript_59918/g.126847 Transcript_59918/m.126847 type:complete len:348 (+) Transcript_59918:326-1369(+)
MRKVLHRSLLYPHLHSLPSPGHAAVAQGSIGTARNGPLMLPSRGHPGQAGSLLSTGASREVQQLLRVRGPVMRLRQVYGAQFDFLVRPPKNRNGRRPVGFLSSSPSGFVLLSAAFAAKFETPRRRCGRGAGLRGCYLGCCPRHEAILAVSVQARRAPASKWIRQTGGIHSLAASTATRPNEPPVPLHQDPLRTHHQISQMGRACGRPFSRRSRRGGAVRAGIACNVYLRKPLRLIWEFLWSTVRHSLHGSRVRCAVSHSPLEIPAVPDDPQAPRPRHIRCSLPTLSRLRPHGRTLRDAACSQLAGEVCSSFIVASCVSGNEAGCWSAGVRSSASGQLEGASRCRRSE